VLSDGVIDRTPLTVLQVTDEFVTSIGAVLARAAMGASMSAVTAIADIRATRGMDGSSSSGSGLSFRERVSRRVTKTTAEDTRNLPTGRGISPVSPDGGDAERR
jgi:hypothetical protein